MTTETGAFHSNHSLPLATAKKQLTALHIATGKGRTHRQNFLRRYDLPDRGYSLKELSEIADVPLGILQEVYNRGVGAYKTNPISVRMKGSFKKGVNAPMSAKLSKEAWAQSRVYSYLDGNPKHDTDLRGGGSVDWYLSLVRQRAKGLKVDYATNKTHKFQLTTPSGQVRRFGRKGMMDYLLWSKAEQEGLVPEGTADERRKSYLARATKIKGNWKADPFSPNNLAIHLLW